MSDMSTKKEPAWMALANHLASYVKIDKDHYLSVYSGQCIGEPAAIVRIWINESKNEADEEAVVASFIKCTIAIAPDEVALTDCDRGIRFVDLNDPKSCEEIIEWMVTIGIAPKGSKWKDP